MRMCIDEARYCDAAGCIDGFTRHNLSACGSLLSVNSGDLPMPDINRSPLVTCLAVTSDEASVSDD
ncbi:hypothetical protein [Sinorhizobium meliloti]|uniref:hypothetical protein n=1 Tax=Rhizobium meliloti TaxID=382 RepID=UPI0004752298|nr:hypothetical protein [Sinorhizobium meliloti]AIM02114.1 hypothetical protein DU99_22990 [Sinorhizobium meliloti]MDE3831953.1 hypothetical protein [Sinorhizobium meliloti]MDE4547736.1 hypothetical protein [Sinorhizobium meliloti]MDE4571375.1 hypothetical protein [Sinorhizobium meliloti]MDE4579646.1 hypothetical protein [Sinorhizobium meliloti]